MLIICALSLFFLVWLEAYRFIFSKNQFFISLILSIGFLFSISLIFALILIFYFPLLTLDLTWISLFSLFWDFGILSVSLILILSVRDGPASHCFCLCLIYKQWEGILRLQMFWFCASTGKGMVRAISSFLNWRQMNVVLNLGGGLEFCHLNYLRSLFWGTQF